MGKHIAMMHVELSRGAKKVVRWHWRVSGGLFNQNYCMCLHMCLKMGVCCSKEFNSEELRRETRR